MRPNKTNVLQAPPQKKGPIKALSIFLGSERLKSLLTSRYLLFFLFLVIYTRILEAFGGLKGIGPAWRLEIPLVLYLYWYFNGITQHSRWQPLITALPLVLIYTMFDLYHLQLGRLMRITEISELPEMLSITPLGIKIILGLVVGMPLVAFLGSLKPHGIFLKILGLLPLVLLVMMVQFFPEWFISAFKKTQKPVVFYSDIKSAGVNGRLTMMLYNEARRKTFNRKMTLYKPNTTFLNAFDEAIAKVSSQTQKNNVHLIMLESFLDPQLLKGAHFSRSPVHPDFEKIFTDKGFLSISPVFGGGTAQAEFEVLCGVPAIRELSGVEFDVFTGQKTYCLPYLLSKSGYHTMATNAFVPDFFNSMNAYAGVGFEESYYPQEYAAGRDTYLTINEVANEKYMFDGDLFTQNLAFITEWMEANPGVPLFNYVMTIYGHTPNDINSKKRPPLIQVTGPIKDRHLERAVNQYYYRTQAIAEFLRKIQLLDPESLVILVSDHVPPLAHGPRTYRELAYVDNDKQYMHLNRIFFFENGQAVHHDTIHHYEIPGMILDYITQKTHSKTQPRDFDLPEPPKTAYWEAYMTIMAQAMTLGTD